MENNLDEEKKVYKTVRKRQGNSIIETRFNKLGKMIDKVVTISNINNKGIGYKNNNFSKQSTTQKKYNSPMVTRKSITIKRNGDLEVSNFREEVKNSQVNNFNKKKSFSGKQYTGPVIMRKSINSRRNEPVIRRKSITIKSNGNNLRKSITYTEPVVRRKSITIKSSRNFENKFSKPLRKSIVIKSERPFTNDSNQNVRTETVKNSTSLRIRKSVNVKSSRNNYNDALRIRKSVVIKSSKNNFNTPLRKSIVVKSKNFGNDIYKSQHENYRTKNDENLEIVSVKRRISNRREANMIKRKTIIAQTVKK